MLAPRIGFFSLLLLERPRVGPDVDDAVDDPKLAAVRLLNGFWNHTIANRFFERNERK